MRVSVFVYLFRVIYLKEAPEVAFQDLLEIWQPDDTWQAFIEFGFKI